MSNYIHSVAPMLWAALTVGLVAALGAVAWSDHRHLRIPDRLSLPLLAFGLIIAALSPAPALQVNLVGAVVGYGGFALFGALYFRLRGHEGLGLGDAKLFGAAGAWLGWQSLAPMLLIAALLGLAVAVATRRVDGRIAFGPALALAFLIQWLVVGLASQAW